MHCAAPTLPEYVPTAQPMHVLLLVAPDDEEYFPDAQPMHLLLVVAPDDEEYFPDAQPMHVLQLWAWHRQSVHPRSCWLMSAYHVILLPANTLTPLGPLRPEYLVLPIFR